MTYTGETKHLVPQLFLVYMVISLQQCHVLTEGKTDTELVLLGACLVQMSKTLL